MKNVSILSIYILLLLSMHGLLAQKAVPHFHLMEGLTSNAYNFYIKKDSKGFVWVSSTDGLNRFDGQNTTQFIPSPSDNSKLASGNITSNIFEDKKGNIWFTVPNYIQMYDKRTNTFKRLVLDKEGVDYRILFLDKEKEELWVKNSKGIYIADLNNLDNYYSLGPIRLGTTACMYKFQNAKYLIIPKSKETGLKLYRDKEKIWERSIPTKKTGITLCGIMENGNNLWLGTADGLANYSILDSTITTIPLHFEGKIIKGIKRIIHFDEDTFILLAENQGIFFFDKQEQRIISEIYHRKDGELQSFSTKVQNIYLDADKTLWISVNGKGVYFTNLENCKFDLALADKNLGLIDCISEDKEGNIWIATEGTIYVKKKDTGMIIPIEHKKGLKVFSILHDEDNTTWISDVLGIFAVPSEDIKNDTNTISTELRYAGNAYDMLRLSNGEILVSMFLHAYVLSSPLKRFSALPKDAPVHTFKIEDREGRLYGFLPEKHILKLEKQGAEWRIKDTIPFLSNLNNVIEDKVEDKLWLATDLGLYELQGGQTVVEHNTLPSFSAKSILQDDNGNLWISSNAGLWKYNPSTKEYWNFNEADGLQSMDFQFQCALETSEGKFLFGGSHGVNIFDPLAIDSIKKSRPPLIIKILVNDTDSLTHKERQEITNISELKHIRVDKGRNTLQFLFSSLDYSDPSNAKFKYQLEGVDKDFVQTRSNFARYPNLPHGEYIFVLKAYNSDGVLSPNSTKLKVTVNPKWYETRLFKVILGLLGLLGVYIMYRVRVAIVERRAEEKRKEEEIKRLAAERKQADAEKKQAQAEEQRTKAKTKLDILRLQMNPHFIFNALVSINNYIGKDPKTAQNFTTQFSKVMRKVLNLSDESYNYIADEVDLLKQYMEVENIRLDNKLSYQFEYETALDDAMLPTMLLQPFIENAILHGIKPKGEPGLITIRFKQLGPQLLCEVEDNGVGYTRTKRENHESKAMSITEQRLALLEEEFEVKTDLKIINIQDESPNQTGVKIRVLLPFME